MLDDIQLYELVLAMPRTGSGYFGLDNPVDDDRYCDIETLDKVIAALDALKIERWYGSRKQRAAFELFGQKFDVFAVTRETAYGIYAASETLKYLCGMQKYKDALSNKNERIALFQRIVRLVDPEYEMDRTFTA